MSFEFAPMTADQLFESEPEAAVKHWAPDLSQYEEIIVFFSGGKDSVACVLHLLELGVAPERIEIHHHLVDGKDEVFMDWPVTESYCEAFAQAFGMRFVTTWREGGFKREMLRQDCPTAPVHIPGPNGGTIPVGGKGPNGTRQKFPQVSADMSVRWCSSYLKSDAGRAYLTNTPRFQDGRKRLIVTGERAEESPGRAKYTEFGAHPQDNRLGKKTQRYLDHWRAVHKWTEAEVWAIKRRWRVAPHPAYRIGFSRCSCKSCIFVGPDNWATLREIALADFKQIAAYENQFGVTIHRTLGVEARADAGQVMPNAAQHAPLAMATAFTEPILVDDWQLPAGAFKNNGGCF